MSFVIFLMSFVLAQATPGLLNIFSLKDFKSSSRTWIKGIQAKPVRLFSSFSHMIVVDVLLDHRTHIITTDHKTHRI